MHQTKHQPALHAFAVITAVSTLVLICFGGLVTSHGAGLAVPDWPNSYGYNMFLFPVSMWVGGIFYEHTHRLVASAVGLLTLILSLWLWLRDPRKWLRWLGVVALGVGGGPGGPGWVAGGLAQGLPGIDSWRAGAGIPRPGGGDRLVHEPVLATGNARGRVRRSREACVGSCWAPLP